MKKQFLFALILITSISAYSQNSTVIDITHEAIKTDSIGIAGDTLYNLTVTVFAIDTANTSKVKLKIGSISGSSESFSGEYNWSTPSSSSPTSNCAYSRMGIEVIAEIKHIVYYSGYYFTSSTINTSGVEDTPFIKQ